MFHNLLFNLCHHNVSICQKKAHILHYSFARNYAKEHTSMHHDRKLFLSLNYF